MELAARRFARWVLIIHLALLAIVITIVAIAANDIYRTQRKQAIDQAAQVQSLLAAQTARGIEEYYGAIIEGLQLFRGTDDNAFSPDEVQRGAVNPLVAGRSIIGPAVWQQLRNRATHVLLFDRQTRRALLAYPTADAAGAQQIIDLAGDWLRSVSVVSISQLHKLPNRENVNLVAVPAVTDGRLVFVAVVPISRIDQQLLSEVHERKEMSALLLDSNMRVLTAYDQSIIGMSLASQGSSETIRERAGKYLKSGQPGTELFEVGFDLGTHHFDRGIVSVQPVNILGQRWWLTIGASLNVVNAIVHDTFRKTLIWGIFLVISVGLILVSTSIQMIRSRLRMERVKHEILTRELSQARKIQLAWLPKAGDEPHHIDICAVNQPASHISGDFYNWFEMDGGKVCVVIGDVTGHGMAAAFLMSTTQLLVRMTMPRAGTPGKCLESVNRQLCQQIFNGQFVTMIILVIDRDKRTMELATAGHPAPLVGIDGNFRELELEPQLVLGVDRDSTYPTETVQLSGAASVLLYTDGLVDTISPTDDRFQLDRLKKALDLLKSTAASPKVLTDRIVQSVDAFRAGRPLEDDLTLVSLNLHPTQQPSDLAASQI